MTVDQALAAAASRLAAAGIDGARREARLLLGAALGVGLEAIVADGDRILANEARFERLLARRLAREPMAYVLGKREFWGLDFAVGPSVLTPRPDSETVVEAALTAAREPRHVLDLGTGSGCLLLAVLRERTRAHGVGVDRSPAAAALAAVNAAALGLGGRARFVVGDWGAALRGSFDLILTNPPYVATGDIAGLAAEVRHEPLLALDGGPDGLVAYRALAADLARLLAPGGVAAVEIGAGQANAVATILAGVGLVEVGRRRDLAGHERCLLAEKGQ